MSLFAHDFINVRSCSIAPIAKFSSEDSVATGASKMKYLIGLVAIAASYGESSNIICALYNDSVNSLERYCVHFEGTVSKDCPQILHTLPWDG